MRKRYLYTRTEAAWIMAKMSKRKKYVVIGLAIVITLAIAVGLPFVPAIRYLTADELTKVSIDMERALADYERIGNPSAIRKYVVDGSDDADRQQSLITLAMWSMTHQDHFIRFVASLQKDQREKFISMFAFVLADSGQSERFDRAFDGHKSPIVEAIIAKNSPIRAQPGRKLDREDR